MLAWRIARPGNTLDLSGRGAALHGGRWNLPEHPALYLGLSPESCALNAVIMAGHLPRLSLKLMQLRLPEEPDLYLKPSLAELPIGWDAVPADKPSMTYGSDWLTRGEHMGLILPSAAMEPTLCLLINPEHPACREIRILEVTDFVYGRRTPQSSVNAACGPRPAHARAHPSTDGLC